MENLMAVVLAAGEGKRMKSKGSKVLHKVCGKPLIEWVYRSIEDAGVKDCVAVVGHKAEQVMECMGDRFKYAMQLEQLGTGHAVMQAGSYLEGKDGYVLVLCGDTPLVSSGTILETIKFHEEKSNSATVITAKLPDPSGYGRIVRDAAGNVLKIVEHRDATEEERSITEVNSGMYCFNIKDLLLSLAELNDKNSQGEYYLTDTLEILISKGKKVGAVLIGNPEEITGINDRAQLAEAAGLMRKKIVGGLMKSGVTMIDPDSVYIDGEVKIGIDSIVYPGAVLEGETVIGENCIIGPNSRIVNSKVGNGVEVNNSVVLESTIGDGTKVGPFAYIRPASAIGSKVRIGDFVEVKKSVIGDGTKVSHLTYVGDAEIGENVNLGCGVVFVNYDGKEKHKTVVGDNSFIGCNVNLVAPVTVSSNTYIAAGSTITEDVPENAMSIARCRQVNKEGWVTRRGKKKAEE